MCDLFPGELTLSFLLFLDTCLHSPDQFDCVKFICGVRPVLLPIMLNENVYFMYPVCIRDPEIIISAFILGRLCGRICFWLFSLILMWLGIQHSARFLYCWIMNLVCIDSFTNSGLSICLNLFFFFIAIITDL